LPRIEVEDHPTDLVDLGDGEWRRDVVWHVPEEWHDQLRKGYRCANCMEKFRHAWPGSCGVCGFRVTRDQQQHLSRAYGGKTDIKPPKTYDADDPDAVERLRERGVWLPGS